MLNSAGCLFPVDVDEVELLPPPPPHDIRVEATRRSERNLVFIVATKLLTNDKELSRIVGTADRLALII